MVELWNGLLLGLGQLLALFYDFVPSYGIAIILLTVVVRLALVPLAVRQLKFQAAMKEKAPQMRKFQEEYKKIQQKYAGDRQKIYEEASKLQQEMGVNPMGQMMGCLPLLLQAPILIGMYQVLASCTGKRINRIMCAPGHGGIKYLPAGSALQTAIMEQNAAFLGMDLGSSAMQVYKVSGVIASAPYFALVAFGAVATWYSTKQSQATMPDDPQTQQIQRVMKFMPLLLAFWAINFPAGLTLYQATFYLWLLGQQWVLTKKFKIGDPAAAAGGSKSSPASSAKSTGPQTSGFFSSVKGLLGGPSGTSNGAGDIGKQAPVERADGTNGARPQAPKPKGSGARKRKKKKKR